MKQLHANLLALLAIATLAVATGPANAATTKPHATPTPIVVHLPSVPLHTDFVVEVNAKGQVVRVEKGTSCKNLMFNAQTYGNVLQMWVRHPDGSAEVGRYRVTYDYDPKTKLVHRGVTLLSTGGSWANSIGAADDMMKKAADQTAAAQKQQQQQQADQAKNLPPLENIVGPTTAPTPH